MPNYDRLPEHMRGGARRYVEQGIRPGDFLNAVLCNDLKAAFSRADDINTTAMRDWVMWMYNDVPSPCQGSPEAVKAWVERGGLDGLDVA